MVEATSEEWKKVVEGMRRGDVGPFTQNNRPDGADEYREYFDEDNDLVACMKVIECNTDKPGQECDREFMIQLPIIEATSYIYIPTGEEIDEWDEQGLDVGEEIAKREPVV